MILDYVERQMDISSTDISSIINQSGSQLMHPISVGLSHKNDTITAYLNINPGAKVLNQTISMQEGNSLETQVSIKEILV